MVRKSLCNIKGDITDPFKTVKGMLVERETSTTTSDHNLRVAVTWKD